MVKRFLKGTLCAALSLSMALGGMMVGADAKEQTVKGTLSESNSLIERNDPIQFKMERMISPKQENKKTRATVGSTYLQATNIWNVTNMESYGKNARIVSYYGQSDANKWEYVKVGTIKVNVNGTVIIPYAATLNGAKTKLKLSGNDNPDLNISQRNDGTSIYAGGLKAGTYGLYTYYSTKNEAVAAAFGAAMVPSQSNRWLGKTPITVGATGSNTYQYFKVKKKGTAQLQVYKESYGKLYGVSFSVQKRSGKTWKNVKTKMYGLSSDNYVDIVGLSAGTYRVVAKGNLGEILYFANVNKTANSSYGTKKKKAKTIKRKKYKKQTFLPSDSTKKAHWYKIKVSKKRSTYIEVTNLGSEGYIWARVSGRTRLKSKRIKNGIRFYGKAKAGTYYIKVYKSGKSTTGSYQIKYRK